MVEQQAAPCHCKVEGSFKSRRVEPSGPPHPLPGRGPPWDAIEYEEQIKMTEELELLMKELERLDSGAYHVRIAAETPVAVPPQSGNGKVTVDVRTSM